jgi:TM2 domain-containing membrane protein YozV
MCATPAPSGRVRRRGHGNVAAMTDPLGQYPQNQDPYGYPPPAQPQQPPGPYPTSAPPDPYSPGYQQPSYPQASQPYSAPPAQPYSGQPYSGPPAAGYPAGGYQAAGYPPAGYPAAPYGGAGFDPMTGQPMSDKSKVVAGLLQLLLGGFAVGRFYTGHIGMALGQLAAGWGAFIVLGCIGIVVWPMLFVCWLGFLWPVIDGIILLVKGGTDAQGRVLRS